MYFKYNITLSRYKIKKILRLLKNLNTMFTKKVNQVSLIHFEPLVGFEPTTPRLQITCSGQLS